MVNIGIKLYDNTIHLVGDIGSSTGVETTITTIVDYQKKAEIEVLINKPEYSDRYFPVGKLILNNLPLLKAGVPRIVFTFYLDTDSTLYIDIADDAVLKKRVKIKKENWEPGIGLVKHPYKEVEAAPKSLFTIDLSVTERNVEKDVIPPVEDKDEEIVRDRDTKDTVIPLIIIISLLVLISSAVLFFIVIRPWEMTETDTPEPTQPVSTQVALRDTPVPTSIPLYEADSTVNDQEEDKSATEEDAKSFIDIGKINKLLTEIGPLYFLPNSTDIKDTEEEKKLQRIVLSIKDYKEDIFLIIKGHTAKAGTENERQTLSSERAQIVRDELVARGAILKEHCRIEGFGSTRPATMEMIKKGYLNRRVELSVEIIK